MLVVGDDVAFNKFLTEYVGLFDLYEKDENSSGAQRDTFKNKPQIDNLSQRSEAADPSAPLDPNDLDVRVFLIP